MANPFESASWFQVARLKPRLKTHVRVRRHRYRGTVQYVLDDGAAGKAHRLTKGAWRFVGRLDGERTVEQLWERLVEELGEDAPTQDDVITALGQLHGSDLLSTDMLPDTGELIKRQRKQRRQLLMQNLKSPMSLRIPLVDPDAFLTRAMPWVRPLFGWAGLALWLAVVGAALLVVGTHWQELPTNIIDRVLSTDNLLIMAVCYPLVKTIHELGHGFAAKAWGREVREMGVMLLVLFPVPYVDASAANALPNKWQRALVGAAGMVSELFVAAIAALLWVMLEPGLARSFAYNVMLIAGISTVLVNGNPLLRFDGYYILADLLEIPNLGSRANRYWGDLVNRHVFRTHDMPPFDATPGEKRWFLVYAPAAFVARMVMLFGIALIVASRFFLIGVLIALWTLWTGVGLPLWKMGAHVVSSPQLHRNRGFAMRLTGGAVAAALLILFVIPAPHHVNAQGVVWLPDQAHVRAATGGFITRVAVSEGSLVRPGQLLIETSQPTLETDVARLDWRRRELQAAADAELGGDRVKRQIGQFAIDEAEQKLAIQRERYGELRLLAGAEGRFVTALAPASDLPGRHVRQGELIGYVTPGQAEVVRVAVSQDDIDLVRRELVRVRYRIAALPGATHEGRVVREVPGGTRDLPSEALALGKGGTIPTDPTDPNGRKALGRIFLFDIGLPSELRQVPFGTRVHVRFQLGWEPIGWQVARRLRQLLLSRFNA
ncbi:site-2 protease family protein [Sphingopyxis granuli]|uniref:Peptidase, M50 family n=1 Tax=Sphingopyxis granuli TaxID=267128 RepID=A0AA86GN67_9SPHN|nr:site-2 protease family protein [Sphingopyxis granuli]AMG75266.1 Peptidase, M50 family [Sphingopyxis granuli]